MIILTGQPASRIHENQNVPIFRVDEDKFAKYIDIQNI